MTENERKDLWKMLEAITPGAWRHECGTLRDIAGGRLAEFSELSTDTWWKGRRVPTHEANCMFAAEAKTAIPALLDRVDSLEREVVQLKAEIDRLWQRLEDA